MKLDGDCDDHSVSEVDAGSRQSLLYGQQQRTSTLGRDNMSLRNVGNDRPSLTTDDKDTMN